MQLSYEDKIGSEKFKQDEIYFHACRYFVEKIHPDKSKSSDAYLGTMKIAKQLWKQLDEIYENAKLTD